MRCIFKFSGVDCTNCAAKLETKIQKTEGVTFAQIDFMSERLTIEATDEALLKVKEICANFEDGVTLKRIK